MLYFLIIGVFAIILLLFILKQPEFATLFVIFLFYTNIAVIAKKTFGIPEFVAGSFIFLLLIPLGVYVIVRHEKVIIDSVLVLMGVFLAIIILSSLFAKDFMIAYKWIIVYLLEGIVLYFLIINVVRNITTFKRVTWVLLFACSLLGSFSLYQDVTRSYSETFYGLAQRKKDDIKDVSNTSAYERIDVGGQDRAGGPLGESNRYAQIMIVILPLALIFIYGVEPGLKKILAVIAASLILSGILLSFSRGAFVSLLFMFFALILFRQIRLYQVASISAVLLLLMVFAAPGYFSRITTIMGAVDMVVENTSYEADAVTLGRTTEMLAALNVFLDHPVLGVGPGQYLPYYSEDYQLDPNIALRHLATPRRAHTLYFELAAEAGLFGFIVFMLMPFHIINRLLQIRSEGLLKSPDISIIATAILLGLLGYFSTAIFLHFSYQRYYWFLLAFSSAAVHILQIELRNLGKTNILSEHSTSTSDNNVD